MLLTVITLFTFSVTPVLAHTEADPQSNPLFAGSPHYGTDKWNPMKVGEVHVWNDGDNLYVTYNTTYSGIGMHETHLAVAIKPSEDVNGDGEINILDADIPQTKKGNPKVGRFLHKHEGLGPATIDPYVIPLEWDVGTELWIAAHAALCNGETAWADCGGDDAYFRGGNWATWFWYIVQ